MKHLFDMHAYTAAFDAGDASTRDTLWRRAPSCNAAKVSYAAFGCWRRVTSIAQLFPVTRLPAGHICCSGEWYRCGVAMIFGGVTLI